GGAGWIGYGADDRSVECLTEQRNGENRKSRQNQAGSRKETLECGRLEATWHIDLPAGNAVSFRVLYHFPLPETTPARHYGITALVNRRDDQIGKVRFCARTDP